MTAHSHHARVCVVDPRSESATVALLQRANVTAHTHVRSFFSLYEVREQNLADVIILQYEPGRQFIESLSLAIEKYASLPMVVVIPTEATSLELAAMLQAGAVDCWRDSMDPVELIARLARVMELGRDGVRLQRLCQYMSPQVAKLILESDQDHLFGSVAKRKRLTFLFLDIRNYTQMTDSLPPETISDILAEYNGGVCKIVNHFGGSVNKFLGDGLFVTFGDPVPDRDHKLNAIKAALQVRQLVREFSGRMGHLPRPFHVGIGINSGKAIVGNFGTPTQIDYTAIGPAVNLAARLQGIAQTEQIIASRSTYEDYLDQVEVASERAEKVRGLEEPVVVGEIVGLK